MPLSSLPCVLHALPISLLDLIILSIQVMLQHRGNIILYFLEFFKSESLLKVSPLSDKSCNVSVNCTVLTVWIQPLEMCAWTCSSALA